MQNIETWLLRWNCFNDQLPKKGAYYFRVPIPTTQREDILCIKKIGIKVSKMKKDINKNMQKLVQIKK